eukprot:CAMPEP_0184346898 /NCGR_PEP_ID=MMETSP1089-20130417/15086_1 /TAXON_ID=38269 ORGANISM="Gloeochaete wittrockiana, Strain SAG46.84" /NCGR_SAMPLE_ID=MMETSP1089 /ASSEMBLY_ACC=CAM_ASM_000445 /LENGTH=83 /DNA_ID=CAMNT_0026677761 /DNA_START=24 /DNA_END=275 /DNA_ORIENTATION=-
MADEGKKRVRVMPVTLEELDDASIPLNSRDYCSHILIQLNNCRSETFSLPWKCGDLRHEYERCQYVEYLRRTEEAKQQQKSKK